MLSFAFALAANRGVTRIIGTVALWAVVLFALASGIDYFAKFSRAILYSNKR